MSVNIVAENALPGTWNLDEMNTGSGTGDLSVMGFVRSPSKNVGETIQFSVNGPATTIHIIRQGHYGGIKPFRVVETIANTPVTQPELEVIPNSNGATSARGWSVTAEWDIPLDAVSGMYYAMIRNAADNDAFYAGPFIVRDDEAEVDIIYKTSDTTWGSAYNFFGTKADYRGKNFYGVGGVGNIMDRAFAGSYHRPNVTRAEVLQTYSWACELPLIGFLEQNGYLVKYITSADLDEQGVNLLLSGKILLSSGHDEYWSQPMWDAVQSFRDDHAGIFISMAGNDIFWRTRFERIGDEVIQWCYKDTMPGPSGFNRNAGAPFDPVSWTGTWIDTRWSGRPTDDQLANGIFGMNGVYDYNAVIPWSNHKVWWASPLHDLPMAELTVQGIVGFEADHVRQHGPDDSFKILATYTRSAPGGLSDPNGERYDVPGNIEWGIASRRVAGGGLSIDFNTCQWAWSLYATHARGAGTPVNPSAQQFTINLLNDMGAAPATLMLGRTLLARNSLDEYGLDPAGSDVNSSRWQKHNGEPVYPYVSRNNTPVRLY